MKKIIWILRVLMFLSAVSCVSVIIFTSPYKDIDFNNKDYFNVLIFLVFVFIFFSSFFSLTFFRIRKKRKEKKDEHLNNRKKNNILKLSFRQGLILSFGFLTIIFLQSYRILTWWVALLVAGALFLIELYFLSERE